MKERFIILGRVPNKSCGNLREILSLFGKTEIVCDTPGEDCIWYPDNEVEGYAGLMRSSGPFPAITAWSRGMYHVENTLDEDEAIWFVEDDVAGNRDAFRRMIEAVRKMNPDLAAFNIRSRENMPRWPHWHDANGFFPNPWRCFKPLSRKSSSLIRQALDFRKLHRRFVFHEVLFSSIASSNGMNCLDFLKLPQAKELFPAFRWRPEIRKVRQGICHPVKNAGLHADICNSDC